MNVVGSHIRKLRKQQRLSQEALAKKLNVTRQAVSQWERDNTQPDIGMLTQIAEVLGADIHEVIYGKQWTSTPRLTPPQRKRYWIGFIVFGAIALIAGVISLVLKHSWSSWVMWPEWYIKYYYIYWFFAVPMFYMNISMGALNGCSLLWDIRIRSRIIRYIAFMITIAFLLVYTGILVFRSLFFIKLQIFTAEYPAILLLPGIGLFLGLNGHGAEQEVKDAPARE